MFPYLTSSLYSFVLAPTVIKLLLLYPQDTQTQAVRESIIGNLISSVNEFYHDHKAKILKINLLTQPYHMPTQASALL